MVAAWSNIDFLAWFDDDERRDCESCGERAAVGFAGVDAVFCLGCGAVWVKGDRLDVESPARPAATARARSRA